MKIAFLSMALLLPAASLAQQTQIDWHKVAGGGGQSTGSVFRVTGTIGQADATPAMSGGNYAVTGGFWSLISVVQTSGAPTLIMTHVGNTVKVSWPYPSTGWTLEQAPNLTSGWSSSPGVSNDGINNSIMLI